MAEAKEHFDEIVEAALSGANITIVRDEAPVVELRPTPAAINAGADLATFDLRLADPARSRGVAVVKII
jgi:antitoxin (DNA-binding transcriptional repressor) of toxin-antitoxin stability system